jgi:DNA uptake protein ComE-like DNA-binding protein
MRILVAAILVLATACAARRAPGLDLNSAPAAALAQLPGLSEEDAHRIVARRPYYVKSDLLQRKVVSESQYRAVEDRLYVGPPGIPEYMSPVPPVTER